MNHPPDDLRFISGLLRATAVPASSDRGSECLDDQALAAVVDGRLGVEARAAAIGHLASCDRCRRAVASVAGLLADSSVAREIAAVDGAGRRRLLPIVLPAAAAAVLLLLAWPPRFGDGDSHRAPPTQGAATTPTPLAPVGAVASAAAMRWAPAEAADRYRVSLFDTGGGLLYEAETRDTVLALPDSIVLVPGRSYLWKVEARTGWDRWSASDLVEFQVTRAVSR